MGKLNRYAENSNLMDITLQLGEETFKFNLSKEVSIDENKIENEILNQSSVYAFLTTLKAKLVRIEKQAEMRVDEVYGTVFSQYKLGGDKPLSDDLSKSLTREHKDYLAAKTDYIEACHNTQIISGAVEVFQQRAFLLQTLSANQRKLSGN